MTIQTAPAIIQRAKSTPKSQDTYDLIDADINVAMSLANNSGTYDMTGVIETDRVEVGEILRARGCACSIAGDTLKWGV